MQRTHDGVARGRPGAEFLRDVQQLPKAYGDGGHHGQRTNLCNKTKHETITQHYINRCIKKQPKSAFWGNPYKLLLCLKKNYAAIYARNDIKYWEGVCDKCFLKDLLKVTLLLKPTS